VGAPAVASGALKGEDEDPVRAQDI